MFKGIDIKLSGPICDCETQNISWYIIEGPGLGLKCETCNTELRIPRTKFRAGFILNTPYPGKKTEVKKPDLKGLDGGKVLDFKKESETDGAT